VDWGGAKKKKRFGQFNFTEWAVQKAEARERNSFAKARTKRSSRNLPDQKIKKGGAGWRLSNLITGRGNAVKGKWFWVAKSVFGTIPRGAKQDRGGDRNGPALNQA